MNSTFLSPFLLAPPAVGMRVIGHYDLRMVALSALVAIFSAWMALQMVEQASQTQQRYLRLVALLTASIALGAGVWAMHFIGMLAFSLCSMVTFDPWITAASMLPSVVASMVALSQVARPEVTRATRIFSGAMVGAGIGAMHYTGMAAMHLPLAIDYDPWRLLLSVVVAVLLAILALWVRARMDQMPAEAALRRFRLSISAVVLGLAVSGMHYTGMSAARFIGASEVVATPESNAAFLALVVTMISLTLASGVMAINTLLRYRVMYQSLHASELRLRTLLNTAIDGVITLDEYGHITEFNPAAERMFGWNRQDILGQNVRCLLTEPLRSDPHFTAQLPERVSRLAGHSVELEAVRQDGVCIPVRLSVGRTWTNNQMLIVGFVSDITERRLAERDLQRFRSIVASSGDAIISLSLSGVIESWNQGAVQLFGYEPHEAIGQSINFLIPEPFTDDDALLARIAQGATYENLETLRRRKDDSLVAISVTCSPLYDQRGQRVGASKIARNISEQRRMETELRAAKERAEQAAAARSIFMANMSHEIRTPMNAILGFTEVLLQSELTEDQRRHQKIVRNSARSLLNLLNDVLDSAKLEWGAMSLESREFTLQPLFVELAETFGASARHKGIDFQLRYDPHLPTRVSADELRLRQVLVNLVGNAVKFTQAGRVMLEARSVADGLLIAVHDTGIGIAAERLGAVFEPFTQADASMSRRFGGSGLGVSICKQLVQLMGGKIWAESVLGEGSVFYVQVPLTVVDAAAEVTDAMPGARASLPALRLLAVDDVPQNLELLQILLSQHGHEVHTCGDGASAITRVLAEHFDAVLMDVQMPDLDGLQTTAEIRRRELAGGKARTPIIALSASVRDADRQAARTAGMDGFATKPVDMGILIAEIGRIIKIRSTSTAVPNQKLNPTIASESEPAANHFSESDSSDPTLNVQAPPQWLNLPRALSRWAHNRAALDHALRRFAETLANAHSEFAVDAHRAVHDEGLGASLQAAAHRQYGLAANLGLERLADALRQIEDTVRLRDEAGLRAALNAYPSLVERSFAAIQTLLAEDTQVRSLGDERGDGASAATSPVASSAMDESAVDWRAVYGAAQRLLAALQRGTFDEPALHILKVSLAAYVPIRDGFRTWQHFQTALDDFDFVFAAQWMQQLLNEHPQLVLMSQHEVTPDILSATTERPIGRNRSRAA